MNFLQKARDSLLALRITSQHFSTILNSKITNKRHKNAKKRRSIDCANDIVGSMRNEIRRQPVTVFNLSWDHMVGWLIFTALYMSANDSESITWTDLRVTNKFFKVGKFANMESMNNQDWCVLIDLWRRKILCPFARSRNWCTVQLNNPIRKLSN